MNPIATTLLTVGLSLAEKLFSKEPEEKQAVSDRLTELYQAEDKDQLEAEVKSLALLASDTPQTEITKTIVDKNSAAWLNGLGWVCTAGAGYNLLGIPIVNLVNHYISNLTSNYIPPLPIADWEEITLLLLLVLGVKAKDAISYIAQLRGNNK